MELTSGRSIAKLVAGFRLQASASAISRSRRHDRRSRCRSRTERSSRASLSAPRVSEDSVPFEKARVDVAALQRSLRRRQILEELISTEEGYIGDVRFLVHTYINLLAALPTLPERLRSSINHNFDQILQLHEEILGELHRVVPDSEYSQTDHLAASASKSVNHKTGHRRWSSLDIVPCDQSSFQLLEREPGMLSEPQVAADVAKIFSKRMYRFFMYKEYGATYEMMIKDATSALENLPEWELHQKGLEAFAFTVESSPSADSKKSLTIGDILVKRLDAYSKNQVRSFGHIQLCGALHVCWQSPTGVNGQYMICLLYKDVLCLASGGRFDPIYTILACIDVHCSTVQNADNGRGLQCHLAPFSWKLVFESDHQLYEVVMTACTSKEENEWRTRLYQPLGLDHIARSSGLQIFLSLDIQSLGTVFGQPGSLSRRMTDDPSSEDQPRQSSFSSDGGFNFSDKVSREESSHSYTTKASTLPETRELSEEGHVSDSRSPRLELTQISELEPLDLVEIISDKSLESETKNAPALQECMTNRIQVSSPQISARTETRSVGKENVSLWADIPVQSTDVPWLKSKGSKYEKKCTGIRRVFR
ncbi:hypothetical protein FBEOM_11520 [Fusarium beomiforme]|uniref:DH domain-containing protein n=1 Tax=Fusarium beomiforme TaxID=44412 RepID=A0A9P5DR90_9HYPO|nr:hypothetical protein FBEOM_11520 [Fusarium beomiforme]